MSHQSDQPSDEELLEMLHQCNEKHGKVTIAIFDDDDEFPSSGIVKERFANWTEAKKQAGLDEYNTEYSDEEILQMLRDCKEENGMCSPRLLNSMDNTCSASLVNRRFGSWSNAKEEAGIEENLKKEATGRDKQYSDEQVLSHVRTCFQEEVTDENGNVLFESGMCTVEKLQAMEGLIAPSVAVERFGSWLEAKKKAGVESDERLNNSRPREYSDEDYLELMRECHEKHGKVTQKIFNEESQRQDRHPTAGAVRKRFSDPDDKRGGWAIAKEKAGLEDNTTRYTDEELLEQLRECKEKYGSTAASTFASKDEFCAPETLQRRFDGWNAAKEAAGLK